MQESSKCELQWTINKPLSRLMTSKQPSHAYGKPAVSNQTSQEWVSTNSQFSKFRFEIPCLVLKDLAKSYVHVQGKVNGTPGSGTCDFFENILVLKYCERSNSSAFGPIATKKNIPTALFQRRRRINRFRNQIPSCLDVILFLRSFQVTFRDFRWILAQDLGSGPRPGSSKNVRKFWFSGPKIFISGICSMKFVVHVAGSERRRKHRKQEL